MINVSTDNAILRQSADKVSPSARFNSAVKSLTVLEHPSHISLLKKFLPDVPAFGVTSYAAYELERNGFKFKIPNEYYDFREFFNEYERLISRLFDFLIVLDRRLWEMDSRFKDFDLKPFFLGAYQFKGPFDTIQRFIYLFGRIIQKESLEEITLISYKGIRSPSVESLMFHPQDAVCREVLEKLCRLFRLKLNVIEAPHEFSLSWLEETVRKSEWVRNAKIFAACFDRGAGPVSAPSVDARILSVDCRNMDVLSEPLRNYGYLVEKLSSNRLFRDLSARPYVFSRSLIDSVDNDRDLQKLCSYENIDFYDLVRERLESYIFNLENYFNRYRELDHFMTEQAYDMVVFNSLSPYDQAGPMLADICRKKSIPYACWMHGGYGGNKTFPGYDMTDLVHSGHYLTYGPAVNRTLETYSIWRQKTLRNVEAHYPRMDLKCHAVGAPVLEANAESYRRPANNKKVVLYVMGQLWTHNQYYMGADAPYTFYHRFDHTKIILKKLISYQDRYNIVIKLYPHDIHGKLFISKFLKDHGGHKIRIVRNERSMQDLLATCDLTLSTWVSTTFFESALTDCDQFLFDDTDLTAEAREVLEQEFFFSSDIETFCQSFSQYLEEGRFYQKTQKQVFRREYLDQEHRVNRVESVRQCLESILKEAKEERS